MEILKRVEPMKSSGDFQSFPYPFNNSDVYRYTNNAAPLNQPNPIELTEQYLKEINLKRELEVLIQKGIKVPYSCKAGGCGTCEAKVEDGEIVHFDSFLTEEKQSSKRTMLSCVSRGKGR